MNWNSPLAEELEPEARGLSPDSTWAVASRYWKSAPVARAALRIAPTTAEPGVPVLSTNIRLGARTRLPRRASSRLRIVDSYGKRSVKFLRPPRTHENRRKRGLAPWAAHGGSNVGGKRRPP